jgi:hypothetical protein
MEKSLRQTTAISFMKPLAAAAGRSGPSIAKCQVLLRDCTGSASAVPDAGPLVFDDLSSFGAGGASGTRNSSFNLTDSDRQTSSRGRPVLGVAETESFRSFGACGRGRTAMPRIGRQERVATASEATMMGGTSAQRLSAPASRDSLPPLRRVAGIRPRCPVNGT